MKNFKWIKLFVFVFIVLSIMTGTSAEAATKAKSTTPAKPIPISKIFYFKDNPDARASLFAHPTSIDILAPQTYSIDNTGLLVGAIDPAILTFAQTNNIKVMPLVTNKGFSKSTANSILDDTAKQDLAINALITEAQQQKYYGWQFDFEGMDATYRDKYSAFVARTYTAMKQHNLILSVAVIAQISSNPADYPRDLWNRIIGVYDYGALGMSADFISIMSYDNPDSKGAISPYPWLVKIVKYSLKYIPPNKISLGIPLYYWLWNDTSGKLISVGGYVGVTNTIKNKHATAGYSATDKTSYLKYKYNKNKFTLWYENAKSVTPKISLIRQYKLQGFSAWVLGLETPSVYSVLK
ncbi:MAG: hypothetical protein KGL67_02200 [Patescibacteria group bacterium]|nr:hypothetical protein [Patescibacteria group bacterium]